MVKPAAVFGGDSDGAAAMERWLLAMCEGCAHEDPTARKRGEGGGYDCDLPALAYLSPNLDITEWSMGRLGSAGPMGVTCMAYQRRDVARG